MSITPPTGILDITDAIVRVSKLEFRGATGFDTILNNVARNTVLLVDQNVEYTTDTPWGLKLPNAWVSEFDAYWASGASGNITFNVYNNTTSGTNGYTIAMDDTTITIAYDGGSALKTVTLGSTLKNDTWRKIHILFERDMLSLAIDGVPVLYFKDTLLRPRVYDEDSGYVIASGLSANRKFKNLRIMNGDKWMTDTTSNIAYVHGNVGIGTTQAAYTLDVKGDIRATGNLLIEGLTTTVDTQNLSIEDAIVEIGRGNDGGTSGKDVGFLFTRNDGTNTTNSNVALIYDESTDRLTLGYSDGSPTDSTLAINTSKSLDVVIPSGNLGVGTGSPDNKLEIADHASRNPTLLKLTCETPPAGTGNESNTAIQLLGTNGTTYGGYIEGYLAQSVSAGLKLGQIGGSGEKIEHMRITGGNVGIGTASPGANLQVYARKDTGTSIQLESLRADNPGYYSSFKMKAIDFSTTPIFRFKAYEFLQNQPNGYPFLVMEGSQGTHFLNIQQNGNVGIGTNNPEKAKLQVHNTIALVSGSYKNGADDDQLAGKIEFFLGGNSGELATPVAAIEGYDKWVGGSYFGAMAFKVHGTERMRINQSGYVGIGTASPLSVLTVKSNYSGGTASGFCLDATNGTQVYNLRLSSYVQAASQVGYKFTVNNTTSTVDALNFGYNGNVGIGTASPSTILHLYNTATPILYMETPTTGRSAYTSYGNSADNNAAYCGIDGAALFGQSSGALALGTNSTPIIFSPNYSTGEKMRITTTGNVGIGLTSPQAKLTLNAYGGPSSFGCLFIGTNDLSQNLRIGVDSTDEYCWIQSHLAKPLRLNPLGNQVQYGTGNTVLSDDRIKVNEVYIENATDTLLKLKPQIYDKKLIWNISKLGETSNTSIVRESGLITQDVWYDTPELRHLVHLGEGAEPGDDKPYTDNDPTTDPDYSSWGDNVSLLDYNGLIPYLIKSNQELYTEIQDTKAQLASVLARLDALESA